MCLGEVKNVLPYNSTSDEENNPRTAASDHHDSGEWSNVEHDDHDTSGEQLEQGDVERVELDGEARALHDGNDKREDSEDAEVKKSIESGSVKDATGVCDAGDGHVDNISDKFGGLNLSDEAVVTKIINNCIEEIQPIGETIILEQNDTVSDLIENAESNNLLNECSSRNIQNDSYAGIEGKYGNIPMATEVVEDADYYDCMLGMDNQLQTNETQSTMRKQIKQNTDSSTHQTVLRTSTRPKKSRKSIIKRSSLPRKDDSHFREQASARSGRSLVQVGRLVHSDGLQYIKRCSDTGPYKENLIYSGRFYDGENLFKLHKEGCLLTCGNRYIALVKVKQSDDLDFEVDFDCAKKLLLKNLKIVEVFRHQELQEHEIADQILQNLLHEMCHGTIDNLQHAEDLYQLWLLPQDKFFNENLKLKMSNNPWISVPLKEAICRVVVKEMKLGNWFQSFFGNPKTPKICARLIKATKQGFDLYRARLIELCPPAMKKQVRKLNDENLLFVRAADIKLLADLENYLSDTILNSVFPKILEKYFRKIQLLKADCLHSVIPTTSQVYFYILKSMIELSTELQDIIQCERLVSFPNDQWELEHFDWTPQSTLEKSLLSQLKQLVNFANHFNPGRLNNNDSYRYTFQVFNKFNSRNDSADIIKRMNQVLGQNSSIETMPAEFFVWICLVDDALCQMFDHQSNTFRVYECLIKVYESMICSGNFQRNSLESLRVVTHNMLRFIAQTGILFNDPYSFDGQVFNHQIGYLNWASPDNRMVFNEYRDLIDVFTAFWNQNKEFNKILFSKLPSLVKETDEIKELLHGCICSALKKQTIARDVIEFHRSYADLLIDFSDLELPWLIRLPEISDCDILLKKGVIELVDNKWKDGNKKCYSVTQFEKFIKLFNALLEIEPPKHYSVGVFKTCLATIQTLIDKVSWQGGESLTEHMKIKASVLMIAAIRSSMMYWKEQADNVCFEQFYKEITSPFDIICNESVNIDDFTKRMTLLKESYWYIRNLNSIDITEAVSLCKSMKQSFGFDTLEAAYQKYDECFKSLISQTAEMSLEEKIHHIVQITKQKVNPQLPSEWTADYKTNSIPSILAGLGAVWSLHSSKDVVNTGQYLKPHCIQILCVLRLLNVDEANSDVFKHLAQVLTGQGKSLILGLIATVLALHEMKVRIICYSQYLAERDESDFEDFFILFSVSSKINYNTFDKLAAYHLSLSIGDANDHVHKCLGLSSVEYTHTSQTIDFSKSALLIDEVDVFFTDKFYGNSYNVGVFPIIPGLGEIQIEIWKLVSNGCKRPNDINYKIEEFVRSSCHPDIQSFKNFLNLPNAYYMLVENDDTLCKKQYTNTSLYQNELKRMIHAAIVVAALNHDHIKDFRLDNNGAIAFLDNLGNFRTSYFWGYFNSFNYFRLKVNNFQQKVDSVKNYGYLNLATARVSYAKLPENYPLILGVTGTLSGLNEYEQNAVKNHYKILKSSTMPTFYGDSNLIFDKKANFSCKNSRSQWMDAIFARINSILTSKRSTLVFFQTDILMEQFARAYSSQLDRLYQLTPNTSADDRERFINDAGVAKTVTLATREMGRGVDFKSSVSVEKNGGIHVIQSFFSVDEKEETQIKGRTARKDNRGSYELIVCLEDLIQDQLVWNAQNSDNISYAILERARKSLIQKKGDEVTKKIKIANTKHEETLKFYANLM